MRLVKPLKFLAAFVVPSLTIMLLVLNGCGTPRSDSATSQPKYSVALPNEHVACSFTQPPFINPRIIQDLSCCISDQGDQVVAINLADSQNSNRYYGEPETRQVEGGNPWVCWKVVTVQQGETNTTEFSYQYVGRTDSGIEVLATADSGGGSAVFRNLMLLKLEYDHGISSDWEKGVVRAGKKRVLLKKLGEVPLGDRWSGDLSVRGNSVLVGKDRGWFSVSGGTGGGPLSVAPKDRLLKIDLESTRPEDTRGTLNYGQEVQLVGTIKQERFPGPPNYESIAKGDKPEEYWILHLSRSIDVAQDPNAQENLAEKNVSKVQLVFQSAEDYATYRSFLGHTVEVRGKLFHAITVHHKAALLVDVREMQKQE